MVIIVLILISTMTRYYMYGNAAWSASKLHKWQASSAILHLASRDTPLAAVWLHAVKAFVAICIAHFVKLALFIRHVVRCDMLCCALLYYATLCCVMLCHATPCYVMPCRITPRCAVLCCAVLCCAVLCCAVLCCAVLCCAVLCCAVLRYAVLCYAAGERRQALEAFVAAFGVEASSSLATNNSHADSVLQVSHAVTATTHCCWMSFMFDCESASAVCGLSLSGNTSK